jgi:hypothetical protein
VRAPTPVFSRTRRRGLKAIRLLALLDFSVIRVAKTDLFSTWARSRTPTSRYLHARLGSSPCTVLDGWANRDLNVGAIVSLAPNLKPFTGLLGVDVETVKKVLASWGPGRYDAELDKDGKAFRPDGKQAG